MWKDAALRCGSMESVSTGGVDGSHGFSTGVFSGSFYPQAVFHMSTKPVDFSFCVFRRLFVTGIDISSNVFDDLCRLRLGFDHLFNALNGMQNGGMITVVKFPADLF